MSRIELSTDVGGIKIRVGNAVVEIADSSVALLAEWLRRMGISERDRETGEVIHSTSMRAVEKLRDSVHSRETVDFDDEEFTSVRLAIEQESNDQREGFDSLPADLVELRHAIVDRRRRP